MCFSERAEGRLARLVPLNSLVAEIEEDNLRSRRLFLGLGFKPTGEVGTNCAGKKTDIYLLRNEPFVGEMKSARFTRGRPGACPPQAPSRL